MIGIRREIQRIICTYSYLKVFSVDKDEARFNNKREDYLIFTTQKQINLKISI